MVLLWAIPIGLIIGLLRGGSILNLEHIELKAPWLILIALVIQFSIFPFGLPGGALLKLEGTLFEVVHLASYALLALFVIFNIKEWMIGVMGLGMLANIVAISSFGGMPVFRENLIASGRWTEAELAPYSCGDVLNNNVLICEREGLWFLGDMFNTPIWFPLANVFSIGDILLAIGMIIFIQAKMAHHRPSGAVEKEAASNE